MKINAQWRRHVEAWRESGLSQADYCRSANLIPKLFHYGTRRVQDDLTLSMGSPLELIAVQVAPSAPLATTRSQRNNSQVSARCSAAEKILETERPAK